MDRQVFGPLFQRALRQFSPDVFHHPVWVRFADSLSSLSADEIQQLTMATNQVQAQGDWVSACQLLILCAVQQSRLGDYSGALASIQGAEKLAERYHLNQVVIWSVWGACALCAQRGDYKPAANHLKHLQSILETNGDWILSDLVQLIHQSLDRFVESKTQPTPSANFPVPTDPLLRNAIDGLLHWGQVEDTLETVTLVNAAQDIVGIPREERDIKTSSLRKLGDRIKKAWHVLRGDLKVAWVENGRPSLTNHAQPSMMLPEPGGNFLNPVVDADKKPCTFSSQRLIESSTSMLFVQPLDGPVEEQPLLAERSKSQPLLPAEIEGKPLLVIYCLGPFRIYQQDRLVADWQSQKGLSILKYLSAHAGRPVAKDILMDLFWSEADSEIARRNLHQAIYALRQTLRREQPGVPYIQFENDCYFLNPELEIWLDYREFEHQVQIAGKLENAGRTAEAMKYYGIAEGLYQGDFLEEDLYEDWPRSQRMHYRTLYLNLLDRLTGYYVQRREFTPAISLCQKVLARDNCNEQAYRWLIQCYLEQGQRQLAMREYQTCLQTLREELDLAPSAETQALFRQIVN